MSATSIQLGLGLISIGREWGYRKQQVPSQNEALTLLHGAIRAGIRALDTAPSYGFSEQRVGMLLSELDSPVRAELFVATKAGEHWNPQDDSLHVDHSYDALVRSIDRSFERLQKISLLQLHKATLEAIASPEVRKALEYAKASGAAQIGASVPDSKTAHAVIQDSFFEAIQFPFHLRNRQMEDVFQAAAEAGMPVLINRPFGMGEILYDNVAEGDEHNRRVSAFRVILENMSAGIVLSGTRSLSHLLDNILAFRDAQHTLEREAGRSAVNAAVK